MKQRKTSFLIVICALLVFGAIGMALMPSGNVARAVGPMASPLPTPPPTGNSCVARATANIRRGPSTRYRIVGRLPRGASFARTGKSGSWISGTSRYGNGWVSASLLRCS